MKRQQNFFIVVLIGFLLSGCVVYSFYPLYTEKDLFPNAILLGEWYESEENVVSEYKVHDEKYEDDLGWSFKHVRVGKKEEGKVDSTSYMLTLRTEEQGKKVVSTFNVHVIELGGQLFLDFYLDDFLGTWEEVTLASFHIIPVHTFARLTVEEDRLIINWFDQEWLGKLIEENKIRIHHEKNDEFTLLTAKPKELQKFVTKYVNSEEAFKEGLEVVLRRK